jgi:hypothetical protein
MGIQTDFLRVMELLDLGPVVDAVKSHSTRTLDMTLTMSFVGIPIVTLNASLTREIPSLKRMMEPFGGLMERVTRFGSGLDDST